MDIFSGSDEDPSNALVEMLHSCTPPANKEKILLSFQTITGTIRLLIATIAFGTGVDWKGVHRVIHCGPAKNVESYIQETGRAGRDGAQSAVYISYHGILLAHVDGHMKQYVKTNHCRRNELLKHVLTVLLGSRKSPIFAAITVLQIANVVCLIVELLHLILVLKRKKTMVHQLIKASGCRAEKNY